MIAACPNCSTRYRVDPAKLGAEGARLRCTKCESVFRVRAPAAAAEVTPAPQVVAPPVSAPAATSAPVSAPLSAAPSAGQSLESPVDRARAVLVADPDVEGGKRTAAAIASWGLHPLLVHDGVEAILAIQRNLPAVAVIDAALPKMFGFQVCEMVKRNESLKSTHIVLVGAIHHADRYRRPPSDLYGADAYIEQPDMPAGLQQLLTRFGLASTALPSPEAPAPTPEPSAVASPPMAPAPIASPVAPAPAPVAAAPVQPAPVAAPPPPAADDPQADARAKAERLARIIVSDIVLYHPDKFAEAVRAGNVAEALQGDLVEGRALFNQRIDAVIRDERDFLMDELNRVAAERSQ